MAIVKLPTDFVDGVTSQKKYLLEQTEDGNYLIDDVSVYTTVGSSFGANEINQTRAKINETITVTESNKNIVNQIINNDIEIDSVTVADMVSSATSSTSSGKASSSTNSFALKINSELQFTNNVCTISDSRITADSLAEVYFSKSCLEDASKSVISVETSAGALTISAGRTPSSKLYATIIIRVVQNGN